MNTQIDKFISNLKSSDFESFMQVLEAYRECGYPEIMDDGIGFNYNSGYVYFALENGIQIASCFGQDVDYIVYDYNTGDEEIFDTYEEAEKYLYNL